ncbi:MAG: ABC transporter substrate-binding protein [Chloroflexota bacterium]|nr:ABC transporter substrate-binding protein [Chloroflexota bacterium]
MKSKYGSKLARWISLALIVVLLVSSLASCAPKEGENVVRIGAVIPVSGGLGPVGTKFVDTIEFALDEINAAGGIKSLDGAKVELVLADDCSDPTTAGTETERLCADESIVLVIGSLVTHIVEVQAPIIENYGMPWMANTGEDEQFEKGRKYMHSLHPLTSTVGNVYAEFTDYAHKNWGIDTSRIAIWSEETGYGEGVTKHCVERLKELGYGDNIVLTETVSNKATDLTPLVLKFKAAKPTWAIIIPMSATGVLWHKACYAQNYFPPTIGTPTGCADKRFWGDLIPLEVAKATIGRTDFFIGDYALPDIQDSQLTWKAFKEKWEAAHPELAFDSRAALAGQMTYIVTKAIENAGSRDREAINEALNEVEITFPDPWQVYPSNYPTSGFKADGSPENAIMCVGQWTLDGNQFTLYPPEIATREEPRFMGEWE